MKIPSMHSLLVESSIPICIPDRICLDRDFLRFRIIGSMIRRALGYLLLNKLPEQFIALLVEDWHKITDIEVFSKSR